ncbi:MAG: hypothetical protein ABR559_08815 [Gemmatimonadota bacterium]
MGAMLWTTSLILLIVWLLGLLLQLGGRGVHLLPAVIVFLILSRIVFGRRS